MKDKTWTTDTKLDVSHYACNSKWKTSAWMLRLLSGDSAGKANAWQRQCQSARAESWQREVGFGSCDALPSHSNGSREWQAGVSSLTWVQQRVGKTLHLTVEPWRKDRREEEDQDECVCVCVCVCVWDPDELCACMRAVCMWWSLLSEVKMTSRWWENINAHFYRCVLNDTNLELHVLFLKLKLLTSYCYSATSCVCIIVHLFIYHSNTVIFYE